NFGGPRVNRGLLDAPIPAQQLGLNARDLEEAAKELRKQAQEEGNRRQDRQAFADNNDVFNYAGALDQARDLVLMPEEKSKGLNKGMARSGQNEGPSVTYALNAKLSVPSRAEEQVVEVARIELAPEYFYKAVPILTPHVYRQAQLANKSKYV